MLGETKTAVVRWKNSTDTTKYLIDLHGENKGYITLMIMYERVIYHYHFRIDELLKQILTQKNTFISVNTFFKPERRVENIKELSVFYIDLDCYKLGLTKDYTLGALFELYVNQNVIPEPTRIIDSGNGLYIMWDIKAVPYKALPLWQALEDKFCNELKTLGTDAKCRDATRVLRVVGSINGKNNELVKIVYNSGLIYDIHDLKAEYLEEIKESTKKGRPKKFVAIYRERSLYQARIMDLVKLCELRNYEMKGYRELVLFLYRYWLCCFINDTDKALSDTLELNNEFKEPLPEREAVRATKSAERAYNSKDRQYKYKNETLIKLLDITDLEQEQMSTIFGKKEFKRRKNIRNQKEYRKNKDVIKNKAKEAYQQNKDKIKHEYYKNLKLRNKRTRNEKLTIMQKKVLTLIHEGLKQEDICYILDISEKTYKRCRRRLKNLI